MGMWICPAMNQGGEDCAWGRVGPWHSWLSSAEDRPPKARGVRALVLPWGPGPCAHGAAQAEQASPPLLLLGSTGYPSDASSLPDEFLRTKPRPQTPSGQAQMALQTELWSPDILLDLTEGECSRIT